MRTILLLVVVGMNGIGLAACSSSSGGNGAGPGDGGADRASSSSGGMDAGADVFMDPNNCIPSGTPNNAAGVGGYCTPMGNQCLHAGPEAGGTICTADFGSQVPAHAWFCTDLCDPDAAATSCGTGGPPCITVEGESVCVPTTCMSFVTALEDGGAGD